jgi:hypothetical protein
MLFVQNRNSRLFENPKLCTGNYNKADSWSLKRVDGSTIEACSLLEAILRACGEDTSWQSPFPFRRKIMIVTAKANCLNSHSSALESPTSLILGLLKRVNSLLLQHEVCLN